MSAGQTYFKKKVSHNQPQVAILLKCSQSSSKTLRIRKQYQIRCRFSSFLYVLLNAQKTIAGTKITKTMSCYPACSEAHKYIEQLDGSEVKKSILLNISNYIAEIKVESKKIKRVLFYQQSIRNMEKQFSKEQIGQLLNLVLQKLIQKVKFSLNNEFPQKRIYPLIQFKWSNQFIKMLVSHFEQKHQNLLALEDQLEALSSMAFNRTYIQQRNQAKKLQDSLQYEKMPLQQLFKHVQNKKVSQMIQKQFKLISDRLINKEFLCRSLQKKLEYFQQTFRNHITLLNNQQKQKRSLKEQLFVADKQLNILNTKVVLLEQELKRSYQQIKEVKKCNVTCQLSQQMRRRFSDLLSQNNQIKSLVDVVLQEIKLTHEIFQETSASNFTKQRFKSQIAKLFETAPALKQINLQEHLNAIQQDMKHGIFRQMSKSSASTLSQNDTESKLQRQTSIVFQSPYKQLRSIQK